MKGERILPFLLIINLLVGCSEKPSAGKQVMITKGLSNKVVDAYWLYLPRNHNSVGKWPVILFLQGGYGVSPNPNTSKNDGPAKFALLYGEKLDEKTPLADTFIIINPHMKVGPTEKRQWYQYPETLAEIVDSVVKNYSGDPDRIYVTGLSRGGIGTWNLAKKLPNKFAAIVPISGRLSCQNDCNEIANIPMWVVHNTGDPTVEYEYSSKSVSHIEEILHRQFLHIQTVYLKSEDVLQSYIFSSLPHDDHDAWNEAYNSTSMYEWMLDKKR